jgi:hypothetical protein
MSLGAMASCCTGCPAANRGPDSVTTTARALTASKLPISRAGWLVWVGHCQSRASALRSLNLGVSFPAVRSLTLLSLAGRVEMWRGGSRSGLSVAAPFVWRCPSNLAVAPFPHPAHRTGHADFPHPALGQDITPSPTTGRVLVPSDERARSARRDARVDRSRPCVA